MTEKQFDPNIISKEEIAIIEEGVSVLGVFHITLGYLYQIRESSDIADFSLQKLHENALAELIPGDDYDAYVSFHTEAYNYLIENSERFKIKV